MKLVLLSRRESNYSCRRLVEAARGRGHDLVPVDPLACVSLVDSRGLATYRNGEPIRASGILPRFGPGLMEVGISVLRQFEHCGIPSLNPPCAIERAGDKFRCLQILARAGIPVPRTVLARSPADLDLVLDLLGGGAVVVKVLKGSQGTGVLLLTERERARRFLGTVWSQKHNVLVQRFVSECRGRDLRIVVAGGRVAASMSRRAGAGEFRSNLHRGSLGLATGVDPEVSGLAVHAVEAIGLDVAGVDVLLSNAGPLVLEVNPSPGIEGIEGTTGRDVAGRLVERLEEIVRDAAAGGGGERAALSSG